MSCRELLFTPPPRFYQRRISMDVLANSKKQHDLIQKLSTRIDDLDARLNTLALPVGPSSTLPASSEIHTSQAVEAASDSVNTMDIPKRECARHCKCRCHRPAALHTSPWARSLVGSLMAQYSRGFWTGKSRCDVLVCTAPSNASIWISYSFPYWLIGRAILLSANWGSLTNVGVSLYLTVPRISEPAGIFHAALQGNPQFFKDKVSKHELTPTDITTFGNGYLSVCWALHLVLVHRPINTRQRFFTPVPRQC